MAGRKRRSWSEEDKRVICQQTVVPGVSVAQVARRYALNANQIFNWLKDPRFQPEEIEIEESAFLPVEISTANTSLSHSATNKFPPCQPGGSITIELVDGHRLTVEGVSGREYTMLNDLESLPDDPVELQDMVTLLAKEVKSQALFIEKLQH